MILLRSLFHLLSKRPARRSGLSKRPQPFRPALEVLEARETPSSLAHSTDFVGDGYGKGGDGSIWGLVPVQKGNHVIYVSPSYGGI